MSAVRSVYIRFTSPYIYIPVEVKRFYRIPKRFTSLCCIYILRLKRSGFRSALLIVEVRLEGVFPAILLHYHTLVFQYGDEVTQSVVAESDTHRGVGFPQSPFEFLVAVFVFQGVRRFQRDAVLPFGDVPIRVELSPVSFFSVFVIELIAVQ